MVHQRSAVDELFATLIEGLELEPGFDVQAFLGQHPEHAPSLRARLERLRRVGLVGDARRESTVVAAMRERFGVHTELPTSPRSPAGPEWAPGELLPSRVVGGRYRILAEVGRGGMGRVFRALDLDLGREVALKVAYLERLLPAAEAAQRQAWVERFLTEAQVTAQLEHPSIVPLHDIGVDRAGQLYYTMKLVEGETLAAKIDKWHAARAAGTPFPTAELLRIVIQVCQAVAFAHERGVLHRDLKPSNVMVGRFGEVQVMDWGLAKLLSGTPDSDTAGPSPRFFRSSTSTLAGEVLGTPSHMAPEQARGDPNAIGRSADVFGVGALLHHGLFGTPPNRPDGESSTPQPRSVPPDLEAICRRALHALPGQRYSSALALADDLQAFLDQRVVRAYEAGPLAELRKWMQRNRALAAAMGAAVLILVAGLVTSLVLGSRAKQRGDDVLRLSALQELQRLDAEADTLWPLAPEQLPAFADWIRRAQELVQELPTHRRDLATRSAEGTRESQWWAEQLRLLVTSMERLDSGLLAPDTAVPGKGWSIPKRKEFLEQLMRGFALGGAHAREWDAALPSIRAAYPGLTLEVQLGLVPIGPDPVTGLWEFADLLTGEVPRRNASGKLRLDGRSAQVLVLIPSGQFLMGAQNLDPEAEGYDPEAFGSEMPPRLVKVSAFFLSKYELTQGQWLTLYGSNPSVYGPGFFKKTDVLDHPVEFVSWKDSSFFCRMIAAALPSEAQWQYACRAGIGDSKWSARISNLADRTLHEAKVSWECEPWSDGHAAPAAVGSFPANRFGLHDMHGNVAEWCMDDYVATFYEHGPEQDPVCIAPEANLKVYAGGSFCSTAKLARVTHRASSPEGQRNGGIGLRPARAIRKGPDR